MATALEFVGLAEFRAALVKVTDKTDAAMAEGLMEGAHLLEAEVKQRASGPARWRKGVNYPRAGGPGVVTGTGRRSYHTEGPERSGLGWSAKVGPSALHMLFVELGTSRGIPGYPALKPALDAVLPDLGVVFQRHVTVGLGI